MTTYPTGVLQNYSTPNMPPDLRPVPTTSWSWFSTLDDAEEGLEMIRTVAPGAEMERATEGMYSQYVYKDRNPDICCRLASGTVNEPGKQPLNIQEYPSEIFDASTTPRPFIDSYTQGQAHVLKCRAVTTDIGELYWAAQDNEV